MEEWQHRPRTGHLESRKSTAAHDNDRARLDVGEISARQCSQLLVPPARWLRARPDPPHHDRSTRPQTARCPLEIYQPWRDPCGCSHEGRLRRSGNTGIIITSSTRPDQPRWIRAGGPSQTVAAICRNTAWTHPPEPDDLQNEGLWCQPLCERRPNVRFCGHQSRSRQMGSSLGCNDSTTEQRVGKMMDDA